MADFLSPEEVAERLHVTPRTVRDWLRAGRLPGFKFAEKEWRIEARDLAAFIASSERAPKGGRALSQFEVGFSRGFGLGVELGQRLLTTKPDVSLTETEMRQLAEARHVEERPAWPAMTQRHGVGMYQGILAGLQYILGHSHGV
jgi:excisionase family DNA binding protein